MKDLELNSRLILVASQPEWKLYPPSKLGYVRIEAPDKANCHWFIRFCSDALDELSKAYSIVLGYRGSQNVIMIPQKVMNSPNNDVTSPILQLGQKIRLTIPLLRVVEQMMSDPSTSYALVRLADQAQIAVNGGAEGRFLAGAALENTVTWKREEYWHPEDLLQFNRAFRQEQSPGSDTWFEYRYRASNPESSTSLLLPTMRLCTRYKLIDDGFGNLYHLGQNLDLVNI